MDQAESQSCSQGETDPDVKTILHMDEEDLGWDTFEPILNIPPAEAEGREAVTTQPTASSTQLKISSWGTRIKTSGWLLFIVGLGRAWRELI